jgi:D-3-phosphoglycerate dehydrogenase
MKSIKDKQKIFIIDFDSTFIQVEALDLLAEIALAGKANQQEVVSKIKEITNLGMEGKVSFADSLKKRVELLSADKSNIAELVKALHKKVTPSFVRNKAFLKRYSDSIYIITGGFKEYVLPVVQKYHIKPENVFGNTFKFDSKGNIIGLDHKNLLSMDKGKVKQLKALNPKGEVYVIGDGYTDFEMKESGLVSKFFSFTENIHRPSVVEKADSTAGSFDEFLHLNKLPRNVSYPKNKIKVLLLENVDKEAARALKAEGFSVETASGAMSQAELSKAIEDVAILGIRSKTDVTPAVLAKAKKLLAIGAFCIGTNQIDLKAASAHGVSVFNAPYSNTRSVVELAIGQIIMLLRKVTYVSNETHAGNWIKSAAGSREVRGRTIGIVGYGNIGMQLSTIAEALGMKVLFYDLVDKLALGNAQRCRSLKELLKQSDIVTLHTDGRLSNTHLFGAEQFAAMKQGSIFLNLSRGHIVDIAALAAALKKGHIAGAAVDVFPYEPANNKEKFVSELCGLKNVILTPHIGGSTEEAQRNIAEYVAARISEYVNNGGSYGSVNFPNISLPILKGAHRLLHVHKNIPGIMAQINSIMAEGKINILGQYLKTTEDIGYVISDVNKKYGEDIISRLREVPGTIKFRVLY